MSSSSVSAELHGIAAVSWGRRSCTARDVFGKPARVASALRDARTGYQREWAGPRAHRAGGVLAGFARQRFRVRKLPAFKRVQRQPGLRHRPGAVVLEAAGLSDGVGERLLGAALLASEHVSKGEQADRRRTPRAPLRLARERELGVGSHLVHASRADQRAQHRDPRRSRGCSERRKPVL